MKFNFKEQQQKQRQKPKPKQQPQPQPQPQPQRPQPQQQQQQQQQQPQNCNSEVFASCTFSSLGLESALCDQLRERLGFENPTHVQSQAIPVILSGRHVLVNAATGTGKTIAYLAPIINHLHKYQPRVQRADGTFALVLVPTHELCTQVYGILQKLLHRFHWIVPGYLMGGENRSKEKARLRKGITILVATPGRLLDHLKNTSSFLHTNLRWLIFDEADRILEMGFDKQIEEILDFFGSRKNRSTNHERGNSRFSDFQRQNMLLSATLNDKVNHLAKISLEDPVMIGLAERELHQNSSSKHFGSVGSEEDETELSGRVKDCFSVDYNLPSQLIQEYVKVPCGARLTVLLSLLMKLFERKATQKVIVFFSTTAAVDFHYTLLNKFQWPPNVTKETIERRFLMNCKTFRLHGSMDNEERINTTPNFKAEKSALLLCTDVGARGLDIDNVRCVIQYDTAADLIEYVHRVGRTARLGKKGNTLLFLQPTEEDYLKELGKHGVSLTEYPLGKVLDSFPLYGQKHLARKLVSIEMHPWLVGLQKALEAFIFAESKLKMMAKDAFVAWIRGYPVHKGELKRIFTRKNLHLGHVAKSFALKDQPSTVGKSVHKQIKKRKKDEQKQTGQWKKRRVAVKT